MQIITDRLYGSANCALQYRRYDNRIVSDKVEGDERDRLFMSGASLFYDITPNVSVGTGVDCRHNFSNEGDQKYTDLIISGGLYSSF